MVIEALVNRADRWGVVDPDMELVDSTFVRQNGGDGHPGAVVDLRTGEEIEPRLPFVNTELWLSACTGLALKDVERAAFRLQSSNGEIVMFWAIAGDYMDGKAELGLP